MADLGLGFLLMGVGMVTVFVILLIVIFGSRGIIYIVNRVAPREAPSKAAASSPVAGDASTMAVLEAAVRDLTHGKGRIVNVTKI